jgi:hypothetical protein
MLDGSEWQLSFVADTQQFGCNIHAHNPHKLRNSGLLAAQERIGTEVAGFAYPFYPTSSAGCLQTSQLTARCGWQSGLQPDSPQTTTGRHHPPQVRAQARG